jgi:hypothetical protein
MNKLIEPKSLLEVREWKRKASDMIEKYGLREAERRGSASFRKAMAKMKERKKPSAKH